MLMLGRARIFALVYPELSRGEPNQWGDYQMEATYGVSQSVNLL